MVKPLNQASAKALLDTQRATSGRVSFDPALVTRSYSNWFKLEHHISETGCSNPECPGKHESGRGANPVVVIRGKNVCRHCFLDDYMGIE